MTFEVGKTYKSRKGGDYTCIHIDGDVAWLRDRSHEGAAYTWHIDGRPRCLAIDDGYTIDLTPKWYDGFIPNERDLQVAFFWDHTPEGNEYWSKQDQRMTLDGARRWVEMHDEYAAWKEKQDEV